jgi:hypothetical protein
MASKDGDGVKEVLLEMFVVGYAFKRRGWDQGGIGGDVCCRLCLQKTGMGSRRYCWRCLLWGIPSKDGDGIKEVLLEMFAVGYAFKRRGWDQGGIAADVCCRLCLQKTGMGSMRYC